MKFIEFSFTKLKNEVETYLKQQYAKTNVNFTAASPYGQILFVIENLFQLSFLYLKNSIKQFDIGDPNVYNERFIKNAAIYAGHIPTRHISSSGTIQMVVKSNSDLSTDINGRSITLFDKQALKNKTNGLDYNIVLGIESRTINLTNTNTIYVNIIQGKWETKTFTGTGNPNQTVQVTVRGQKEIENDNVEIYVNGELWGIKAGLYDLNTDEKACVVRTGFNGGIDVIFGNSNLGFIPPIGSIIEVKYLLSDGSNGDLFSRTPNDWIFVDPAVDALGNPIDVSKVFDVVICTDVTFGADKESVQFTKNLLPIVSNNFVLGTAQQYAYTLLKLGVFSHVNAYEDSGLLSIVATPNIRLFRNQNADYFSVDMAAFTLDDYEIRKIDKYLKSGMRIQLSKKYEITSPDLSFYYINVFVIRYSDSVEDNVNAEIFNVISEYYLNLTRMDRIPKVDIINALSTIKDLHSIDINFVCKKNEDYHRAGLTYQNNINNQYANPNDVNINTIGPYYDPSKVIGIDPILGDLLFDAYEYPVIRGGWYTRDNIYVNDDIYSNGLKPVNIIYKGTIDPSHRPKL